MIKLPSFSLIYLLLPIFIFSAISCSDRQAVGMDERLIAEYREMSQAIVARDTEQLLEFTAHELADVQSMAWRALSKSSFDSLQLELLIQDAMESADPGAWTSLRHQSFSDSQIERINQFASVTHDVSIMCEFFFRKGNLDIVELLISQEDLLLNDPGCAKAMGGILSRTEVSESVLQAVIRLAFDSQSDEVRRNLLYGLYRSELNRPQEGSALHRSFINRFEELEAPNQTDWIYAVRIGGKEGFRLAMERLSDTQLNEYVQLSNMLAGLVSQFDGDELPNDSVIRLLQHGEEIVVAGVLESLELVDVVDSSILDLVESSLASSTGDPHVMVHSMHLLLAKDRDIFRFYSKIERMDQNAPYLKNHFLPLFDEIETSDQFSQRLKNELASGGIQGMHAARYLPELANTNEVRNLFRYALENGDVSVISGIAGLMDNRDIVSNQDFEFLQRAYSRFAENNETGKISELNAAMEERFQDRFTPIDPEPRPFRIPDWERLKELGPRPLWILETSAGEITIELYTEKAPFTVSSIDSLTRAGHYNETIIHRVVPNFVIQGGDYTRRDGFGSPDFRIPTEPSFDSFERAKVGIASSGQDTEGGQFFIMHQWAPHLDGNYTIFGEVIRGMEVVDRIQVGDHVVGTELVIGSLRI